MARSNSRSTKSPRGKKNSRPTTSKSPPTVRVTERHGKFHIWHCRNGVPQTLMGIVGVKLAFDARRHGQDFVGELVDRTLRAAERSSSQLTA